MSFRTEYDTMGAVQVPADKYWGAQTERSRNNFKIGPEASMPKEIIAAFAYLKKAAAYTNTDLGVLTAEKRDLIAQVCDEILDNKLDSEFRFGHTIEHERERGSGQPFARAARQHFRRGQNLYPPER
jgi:fumarate hydratase class II